MSKPQQTYSVGCDGEQMWLLYSDEHGTFRAEINTTQADILARELIDASFRHRRAHGLRTVPVVDQGRSVCRLRAVPRPCADVGACREQRQRRT